MNPEYKTALIRASIGGLITAGTVFFAAVMVDPLAALAGAGGAFFAYLGARGFVEGQLDAARSKQLPSSTVTITQTQTNPPPETPA